MAPMTMQLRLDLREDGPLYIYGYVYYRADLVLYKAYSCIHCSFDDLEPHLEKMKQKVIAECGTFLLFCHSLEE